MVDGNITHCSWYKVYKHYVLEAVGRTSRSSCYQKLSNRNECLEVYQPRKILHFEKTSFDNGETTILMNGKHYGSNEAIPTLPMPYTLRHTRGRNILYITVCEIPKKIRNSKTFIMRLFVFCVFTNYGVFKA